jgi:hypothetical protein
MTPVAAKNPALERFIGNDNCTVAILVGLSMLGGFGLSVLLCTLATDYPALAWVICTGG